MAINKFKSLILSNAFLYSIFATAAAQQDIQQQVIDGFKFGIRFIFAEAEGNEVIAGIRLLILILSIAITYSVLSRLPQFQGGGAVVIGLIVGYAGAVFMPTDMLGTIVLAFPIVLWMFIIINIIKPLAGSRASGTFVTGLILIISAVVIWGTIDRVHDLIPATETSLLFEFYRVIIGVSGILGVLTFIYGLYSASYGKSKGLLLKGKGLLRGAVQAFRSTENIQGQLTSEFGTVRTEQQINSRAAILTTRIGADLGRLNAAVNTKQYQFAVQILGVLKQEINQEKVLLQDEQQTLVAVIADGHRIVGEQRAAGQQTPVAAQLVQQAEQRMQQVEQRLNQIILTERALTGDISLKLDELAKLLAEAQTLAATNQAQSTALFLQANQVLRDVVAHLQRIRAEQALDAAQITALEQLLNTTRTTIQKEVRDDLIYVHENQVENFIADRLVQIGNKLNALPAGDPQRAEIPHVKAVVLVLQQSRTILDARQRLARFNNVIAQARRTRTRLTDPASQALMDEIIAKETQVNQLIAQEAQLG